MAELVKIFDVNLYVAFTEDAAKCYEFLKYLKDNGITYNFLHYGDDPTAQNTTLAALSTWRFGAEYEQVTFTTFPLVIYKEGYDDWTTQHKYVRTMEELLASTLVTRKELAK